MRSFALLILVYVTLGLQLGLGDVVGWSAWGPSLPLIVAVWIALRGQPETATLWPFLIGLGFDLITPTPLGLYAFLFGAVALLVGTFRKQVIATAPAVQASVTLAAGLLITAFTPALIWLRLTDEYRPSVGAMLLSALLSGILAPLLMPLLEKLAPTLGLRRNARVFD